MSEPFEHFQIPLSTTNGEPQEFAFTAYSQDPTIARHQKALELMRQDTRRRRNGYRLAEEARKMEGWFYWVPSGLGSLMFYMNSKEHRKKAKRIKGSWDSSNLGDFKKILRQETMRRLDDLERTNWQGDWNLKEHEMNQQTEKELQKASREVLVKSGALGFGGDAEISRNSFLSWLIDGQGKEPNIHSNMNCWEAVLYSAIKATILNPGDLRSFYLKAFESKNDGFTTELFNGKEAVPFMPDEGLTPEPGDIFMWEGAALRGFDHVAVCIEGGKSPMIMSHWAPAANRLQGLNPEQRHFHFCPITEMPHSLGQALFVTCPW